MSLSDAAPIVRAENDPQQLCFTFADRHWRVRGLETQLSCERLRVNLMVSRRELVYVDTLDLYTARQRRMFVNQAATELYVEEATVKQDLGRVLLELETRQDAMIREALAQKEPDVPTMTEQEQLEAMGLLEDPQLLKRILEDFDTCGLVGEETNKLVCYLACVSRHLPRPLAVLVQSSSAAGKSSLVEATLRFMPSESQHRISALTGQSLFYMQRSALKHKILAVAEQQGATEASYALKLLQSEGRLAIACVGKDRLTGRQQTQHYEVEGPVALLLTTTDEHPDAELANRCLTVSVCEQSEQTAAIHACQRSAYLSQATDTNDQRKVEAIERRHQQAQRLLEPRRVVIPFAEQLTFRTDQIRYRRDHAKYLSLIASLALLHQYQRKRITRGSESFVVATLDDARVANRLACETFGLRLDELLPQTRQLLAQMDAYVSWCAETQAIAREQVRFTQRQLREALHCSDRALRRQLTRLVQLEYVLMYRTGRGNSRVYQLLYDSTTHDSSVWQLGLQDVDRLAKKRRAMTENQPSLPQPSDSAV